MLVGKTSEKLRAESAIELAQDLKGCGVSDNCCTCIASDSDGHRAREQFEAPWLGEDGTSSLTGATSSSLLLLLRLLLRIIINVSIIFTIMIMKSSSFAVTIVLVAARSHVSCTGSTFVSMFDFSVLSRELFVTYC